MVKAHIHKENNFEEDINMLRGRVPNSALKKINFQMNYGINKTLVYIKY